MITRIALLADIHANLEALEAVFVDLAHRGSDRFAVLGDTIGYGPDPLACVERVIQVADMVIIGNHERQAMFPDAAPYMEDDAQEVISCTASQTPCVNLRPSGDLIIHPRCRPRGGGAPAIRGVSVGAWLRCQRHRGQLSREIASRGPLFTPPG